MSDEVSDFLRSVELLKERREEEDEARSRELEERILQEKRERQARRAERARSISPQKSSPANTPSPTSHRIGVLSVADGTSLPSPAFERSGSPLPRGVSSLDEPTDSVTDLSSSPTKENESPFDSDTKRTSVSLTSPSVGVASARSPLSWQRRPRSQTSDRTKMRPLSMVAAENAARNSPNLSEAAPPAEETLSRDQIAQSLASKDPSWFRQTADPGRGSGAFRKSQVEDEDTVDVSSSSRTQLPGMSRPSVIDSPRDSPRPESQTLPRQLGSPLPITSAQRLEPPTGDAVGEPDPPNTNRHSIGSPTGRTSPARAVSPTKGMGGFVQSAMMKRSDSVKRWSVNSPGGLQRADSVLSPRASPRPTSMLFREGSSTPLSRPTSSHEKEEPEKAEVQEEDQKEEKQQEQEEDIPAGAKTPTQPKAEPEKTTPPTSPSKTMDPRRWSPTKSSSWLEAALNKPESPKSKPAPVSTSNQPSWMLELNKAKAQKVVSTSSELPRSPSFLKKTEVKTDGLMRSTPMGASLKPSALSSFPAVPPVATSDKAPVSDFRNNLRKASPTNEAFEASASLPTKAKPDALPKNDFRGNLKHRSPAFDGNKSSEAVDELKTVFGSLRRTKTQNYVAADELKDNIVRGKRGLSITGGPKKTERVDEFKDAILKKKEDFKKVQEQGRGVTRESSSASERSLPEGLVKKLELNRTGTLSKSSTPELPLASPVLGSSNRSSYFSTSKPEITTPSASKFSPEAEQPPAEPATAQKQTIIPGRLGGRAGGSIGGLAERFNPALAGLIARGPLGASGPAKSPGTSSSPGSGEPAAMEEPTKPGPQLTHMTKGRARGPKRKAPSAVAKAAEQPGEKATSADSNKGTATSPPAAKPLTSPKPSRFATSVGTDKDATSSTTEKPATSPKPDRFAAPKTESESAADRRKSFILQRRKSVAEVIALVDSSKRASKEDTEPTGQPISLVGSPSIRTRPCSPTKVHEQAAALAALSQQASKPADDEPPSASTPIKTRPRSTTKVHEQAAALAALAAKGQQAAEEPAAVPNPIRTRSRSPTKVFDQVAALAAKNQALGAAEEDTASAPSSPKKLDLKRISKFMDQQDQANILPEPVKSRPASPAKESFTSVASPQPEPLALRSSSPSKDRFSGLASPPAGKQLLSEKPQLGPAAPIKSTSPVLGRSVGLGLTQSDVPPKPIRKDTKEFENPPRVPPKGARPLPEPPAITSPPPRAVASPPPRVPSPLRSPSKHASDVSAMLTDFFGSERPRRKYTTDAAEILMKRPVSTATVRTQQAQLFQLTPEGKKMPVPTHHERVLFEREMYICPHSFIDSSGRNVNEIYFWAGDEVPQTVVEDTYLFAAREARSFGGKLIKLLQGKESSEFLQALGGIIIVRRGSSNKYDSLAPHMLCGRRYLGQVAFDEVDFSPLSLCSGFPYLITQQGKCTLWKGKGSDVEELGCARLVGMDLALMGELHEVDEGYETRRFWDIFGAGANDTTRPISADHWRLKPNYDKYSGRLFAANADASSTTQIEELSPFRQTDLSPSKIYVLDAFFEIYIIVGGKSQMQYASFHNALDFAQEYAILAAGMEDRPFVPVATVVLEGIPRDLKAVFRKWRDGASPTRTVVPPQQQQQQQQQAAEPQRSSSSGSSKGGLRRARSLKIVPLGLALRAVQE
ncbi:hypothetical protein B0T21DRAFT_364478 [Apiosordaria backusii]|uniref:DUF4045 domain-containing protein n=1 Tax=Apiosordaria backusii TaxID=314023 RepID=A0AA40BMX3_9PEZI|nr:hypothetical protein B0T21DRAFT_364478 [Apiosordaria backusii]